MKSQAAFEYLLVVAFVLAIILPIFYYSLTYSSDSLINSQAQDTVNTLAKTADYVYSLGDGSSTQILITIPKNVVSSSVQDKTISLKIGTSSGTSDIVATTKATVSGSIPTTSGSRNIALTMSNGVVNIQEVS